MKSRFAFLVLVILLAACQMSTSQKSALRTEVATEIYATLTVAISTQPPLPTSTNTPKPSPTLTPTYTPTPLPLPTDTQVPQALVISDVLNLREGPGKEFPSLGVLNKGDELVVTGQYKECSWLKVRTPNDGEGWVSGYTTYVQLDLACGSIPHGTYRPLNGSLVLDQRSNHGSGLLEVDNGTLNDDVVILVDMDNNPLVAFYIRSESKSDLTGIPDGDYRVFFSTGQEWDGEQGIFLTNPSYERFDEVCNYATNASQYTIYTLTLHPVFGGEGSTSPVDPQDFPPLGGG